MIMLKSQYTNIQDDAMLRVPQPQQSAIEYRRSGLHLTQDNNSNVPSTEATVE